MYNLERSGNYLVQPRHFTDRLSLTPHNNCCLKVSGLLESEPSDNTTMYVPLRYQTQKPNSSI